MRVRIGVAYRPEDSGFGGRLLDDLAEKLRHDRVGPARGKAEHDVVVAVVGPGWTADPRADRLSRRLAAAFQQGAGVVVALVEGAALPPSDALPPELAALDDLDPVSASDDYWDASVDRVVERVRALARPSAGGGLWDRLRRRPRLSVGAAVATVGGLVGILSTLGLLESAPPERGEVVIQPRVASGLTFDAWARTNRDPGEEPRSYPFQGRVWDGRGFDVRLELENPEDEWYSLRWTAREVGQGQPLAGLTDILWRTYSVDEVDRLHAVWVPCPLVDAVPYVITFELVNESRAGRPRLDSAESPTPLECRISG